MSATTDRDFEIEPDRYELAAGPLYRFGLSRRDLFRTLGGGILILIALPPLSAEAQESGGGRRGSGAGEPQELGAWLHIAEDGMVTAYTGKVEVGQNARTSLTQAVAEELHLAPEAVHLVMGDTALTPFDMGTFGSRTTPTMMPQVRKAAAAAREMLIGLAADKLAVERSALTLARGKVVQTGSDRACSFGELTRGQKLTTLISDTVTLTPPESWKVLGTPQRKVTGRDVVTGRHKFTSDMTRPGMLHGRVLRPSAYGAKLTALETKKAEALPGVTVVHDGDFVGVTAPSVAQAEAAIEALQPKWDAPPSPPASKDLFALLKSTGGDGDNNFTLGSIADGLAAASQKRQATYTVAYIAHTPLEPRAALAEWEGDKLTVWTGSQRPFGVRGELAAAFHLPEDKVRIIVPDTGSGYGGKHTGECAIEAARLAKAAGKPVKLVWARPEEFSWAYFRPAGVIEVTAGVGSDGHLTAWEFHNYNSGTAAIRPVYDIPNQKVVFHPSQSPLRQGSYRGLAATANHFAREVHIDEMAHSVGIDPLEFRLRNIKDPRMRAVVEVAAQAFGWGKTKTPAGHGVGIACGFDKGGYVATCAEISINKATGGDRVRIERVATAFECGAIVNPDELKNQVEGAMIQGIGGALFEAIDFGEGRVLNPYLSTYRVPRFRDVPPVMTTVLLDRKDLPSAGAGESPIVGIAPALGNAIFAATGVRLRSLPLLPGGKLQG